VQHFKEKHLIQALALYETIYKNMVSIRCKMIVKHELKNLDCIAHW